MNPAIESFFDDVTATFTHVVFEAPGSPAIIIDPVLDYDPKSGRTRPISADAVVEFVQANSLSVEWILETHAHADHVTAALYLQGRVGGRTAIGENIRAVQSAFRDVFNLGETFPTDGSQFDRLLVDAEEIGFGNLVCRAMAVPGHTPACMAYVVGDAIFVGDTMFMPDVGTARCDFPGGNAATLYRSIRKILAYPPQTRLFMCHDYPTTGRAVSAFTTVADERRDNIHVHDGVAEAQFVAMRQARDAKLPMPVLILPSIQINIRAGRMPEPEDNGVSYLKIPLNQL
ncbi:MAG: MBL fold metallo-hydrolase [Burkholderiales bacterium]